MREIICKMTQEESDTIEYYHYLYNSSNDLLKMLLEKKEVSNELIQQYSQERNNNYFLVEKEKDKVIKKYKPNNLINYNCQFIFSEKQIIFKELI